MNNVMSMMTISLLNNEKRIEISDAYCSGVDFFSGGGAGSQDRLGNIDLKAYTGYRHHWSLRHFLKGLSRCSCRSVEKFHAGLGLSRSICAWPREDWSAVYLVGKFLCLPPPII